MKFKRELEFLFGCVGIYGSFIFYGIYQEKIFKLHYKDEQFSFSFAVLFI